MCERKRTPDDERRPVIVLCHGRKSRSNLVGSFDFEPMNFDLQPASRARDGVQVAGVFKNCM